MSEVFKLSDEFLARMAEVKDDSAVLLAVQIQPHDQERLKSFANGLKQQLGPKADSVVLMAVSDIEQIKLMELRSSANRAWQVRPDTNELKLEKEIQPIDPLTCRDPSPIFDDKDRENFDKFKSFLTNDGSDPDADDPSIGGLAREDS